MRHAALPTALSVAALAAAPAAAQEARSFWDLLNPDTIVAQYVRAGVIAARTQADLRYSDLTVSLLGGLIAVDDLELTLYDNITGGDVCDVSVGRLELRGADPFSPDRLAVTLSARPVTLAPDCLPPEAGPLRALAGPEGVTLPDLELVLDYDVPSSAAELSATVGAAGIASARAEVAFDYVTIWAGEGGAGDLVGDLSHAAIEIEDLGGWDVAAPFLPLGLNDPETASAAMTETLGGALEAMAGGEPLPKPVKAFVTEAAQGWADFVADPGRLVIESGFDPSDPRFVDQEVFDDGPLALIELLEPTVSRAPAAEGRALPAALIARALSEPEALAPADRRRAGLALLTGDGAPLAVSRGVALLDGLAAEDGAVAVALARAQAARDPEAAYAAALAAGGTGTPGLRPVLDGLERALPFDTRLRLQAAAVPLPTDLDLPVRALAARAAAHLSGTDAPRSLRAATVYASLAAARGDRSAARLLERIEREIPIEARADWAPVAEEAADAALAAWTSDR